MFFNRANLHRLCGIAIRKSNNLSHTISYFRTAQGRIIKIFFDLNDKKPCIMIAVDRATEGLYIEETYYLFSDGSCHIRIYTNITSTTGLAQHTLQDYQKYELGGTLTEPPYENWTWLRTQLDTLADWLDDKKTVRIDPYNPDRILTEEETDVDCLLANNLAMLGNFQKRLHNTPLTPGIHVIRLQH